MGSRQSSGGSQAGPRQAALPSEAGAARGKGHRRTASSGQGTATTGDMGPEWTEEVDQVQCIRQATVLTTVLSQHAYSTCVIMLACLWSFRHGSVSMKRVCVKA